MDFYEGRHDPDYSAWLKYVVDVIRRAATDLSHPAEALQAQKEPPNPHPWEGLDRRSQHLLTRLRARQVAGQGQAEQFRPADLEVWFVVSSTTAQDWLRSWQDQGFLEPANPGRAGS